MSLWYFTIVFVCESVYSSVLLIIINELKLVLNIRSAAIRCQLCLHCLTAGGVSKELEYGHKQGNIPVAVIQVL